jgi:hypothetical protein
LATHLSEEAILLLTAGDVTPESNGDIARHLESCAECRMRLEESFAFRGELRLALEERKAPRFQQCYGRSDGRNNCSGRGQPPRLPWQCSRGH